MDGIYPSILKMSASTLAPTLLNIINLSFEERHFPDILKIAKLFPIHKAGSKLAPQITDRFPFYQFFRKLLKNILLNICLLFATI